MKKLFLILIITCVSVFTFAQQDTTSSIELISTVKFNKNELLKSNYYKSDVIEILNKNDTINIVGYKSPYWIVKRHEHTGYIMERFVVETHEMTNFKILQDKRHEEAIEKEKLERMQREREVLIKKYGKEIGNKLLKGYYWIGMTDSMARVSLGNPDDINRSVGPWGVHEQWVYPNMYLYFEDGILSSYQN